MIRLLPINMPFQLGSILQGFYVREIKHGVISCLPSKKWRKLSTKDINSPTGDFLIQSIHFCIKTTSELRHHAICNITNFVVTELKPVNKLKCFLFILRTFNWNFRWHDWLNFENLHCQLPSINFLIFTPFNTIYIYFLSSIIIIFFFDWLYYLIWIFFFLFVCLFHWVWTE